VTGVSACAATYGFLGIGAPTTDLGDPFVGGFPGSHWLVREALVAL
jgi:hypothetical protein